MKKSWILLIYENWYFFTSNIWSRVLFYFHFLKLQNLKIVSIANLCHNLRIYNYFINKIYILSTFLNILYKTILAGSISSLIKLKLRHAKNRRYLIYGSNNVPFLNILNFLKYILKLLNLVFKHNTQIMCKICII